MISSEEMRRGSQNSADDSSVSEHKTISLAISPSYVQDWDTTAAFRELYQNWRDAILEHFNLDRLSFQPIYEERDDYISILVPEHNSQSKLALGFIKYEKRSGRVTIVNPCAQISTEALELGYSSKRGNGKLTGCHGEGLKVAALVMIRSGYSLTIDTANSHWDFGIVDSKLRCMIRPWKTSNPNIPSDAKSDMAQLKSLVERDVTIVIESTSADGEKGISLETFHAWIKITLEIRGISYPSRIIETDAGDLVLDTNFSSRLYLNGIFLPAAFANLKPYRFCYNFTRGKINRDRQILIDKSEEADAVRKIWEAAIEKHEEVVLPLYFDLLRNSPESPDVASVDVLKNSTKTLIWRRCLRDAGDTGWFYSEKSSAQSVSVIRDVLGKEPVRLPSMLWNLLRTNSPLRTPQEEQIEQFKMAEMCRCPPSSFSQTVKRVMNSCLLLITGLASIDVQFVRGNKIGVDCVFDNETRILKIHHRWLDFSAIHKESRCRDHFPTEMSRNNSPFLCDHIIEELLRLSLSEIFKPSIPSREWTNAFLRQVRFFLRYMPHSIKSIQELKSGLLKITWEDNETEFIRRSLTSGTLYHIILHEETCLHKSDLLHDATVIPTVGQAPCGCLQTFADQRNRIAIFDNIDYKKGYVLTIALNQQLAFYGQPISTWKIDSTPGVATHSASENTINCKPSRNISTSKTGTCGLVSKLSPAHLLEQFYQRNFSAMPYDKRHQVTMSKCQQGLASTEADNRKMRPPQIPLKREPDSANQMDCKEKRPKISS